MSAPLTPDETTTRVETVGTSPKAVAAAGASAVVGVLLAILTLVQSEQGQALLLGSLPPALQAILLAAVPPLAAFLAAYVAKPGSVRQLP